MKTWMNAKSPEVVGYFYDEKYDAHGFEAFADPNHSFFFDWIIKNSPLINPNGKLLDVGCGHGHFLAEIIKRWPFVRPNLFGIDVSRQAIVLANERLKGSAELVRTSIEDCGENWAESFEYITAWGVLEHTMDPVESFKKMLTMLAPGGRILITLPIEFPECFDLLEKEMNNRTNERFATAEEWVELFGKVKKPAFDQVIQAPMRDIFMVFEK